MIARTRAVAALAVAALLLGAGCPGGGSTGSKSTEEKYRAFAQRFGDALMAEKYSQAYAMCSSHLKAKMDVYAFEETHRAARRKWGTPLKVNADVNSVNPAELGEPVYDADFPPEVPKSARRARMCVGLQTDLSSPDIAYDCWINVVDEGGEDRVASFQYLLD